MIGVFLVTITAFLFGLCFVLLESFLGKEEQQKKEIEQNLPGYNCGACGFSGCSGMAEAILQDFENYKKCRFLKEEQIKKIEETKK